MISVDKFTKSVTDQVAGHAVAGDSRKRNVISPFAAKIQARGVLQEPRQCSIACLGPCLSWGIRSNGERAVTAVVSSRSIPPRWTSVSHSLFNPAQPEAALISASQRLCGEDASLVGLTQLAL